MKASLFDTLGAEKGTIDLDTSFFGVTPNMGLIHRLLVLQQANGRIAIAHAKHRGEVAGSTRKLFKQKGTGSARMGDRRSPMRRGGGAVFGPRNERNYTLVLSKQERRLALLSLLSTKANDKAVKVLEELSIDHAKTKTMSTLLSAISAPHAVLAVTREESARVQGAYNLPTIKVVNVEYLNPHSLLKYKHLVFTKSSLEHMYTHFSK
jgi:large subunit ribosomal protein L4